MLVEFRLKVLVVEDEPLVRALIEGNLIAAGYDVDSADKSASAVKIAKSFDPDVAVIDVDLGSGPSGVDLAHRLRLTNKQMGILFLSNLGSYYLSQLSFGATFGPYAYLQKEKVADIKILIDAINQASMGNYQPEQSLQETANSLSRGQFEVLRAVASGRTSEQIALERGTSVRAVNRMINRACDSLGVAPGSQGARRVLAAIQLVRTSLGGPIG